MGLDSIVYLDIALISITIVCGIVAIISNLSFLRYLKEKKPEILELLINKQSIISLPDFMNLNPLPFLSYCSSINLKADGKIITRYKIIYLVSIILAITCFTISILMQS